MSSAAATSGENFSWIGSLGLTPFLSATELTAVESRSTWEFRSGVVLGLGGAALLALAQELPSNLGVRRRSRKWRNEAEAPVIANNESLKPGDLATAPIVLRNGWSSRLAWLAVGLLVLRLRSMAISRRRKR
jgi:hypothetical protein